MNNWEWINTFWRTSERWWAGERSWLPAIFRGSLAEKLPWCGYWTFARKVVNRKRRKRCEQKKGPSRKEIPRRKMAKRKRCQGKELSREEMSGERGVKEKDLSCETEWRQEKELSREMLCFRFSNSIFEGIRRMSRRKCVLFFKVAGAQDRVFFHVFPMHYSPQLRSAATVSKWSYIGISWIVDAKPGQVAEADAGRICKGASIAQLDLHRYQSPCLDIQVLVSILFLYLSYFYEYPYFY